MALTILNNIAAIAAENQLNITSNSLNSTLEQLSSGSRINSGADDPAGLAIANGLEANIAALTQSSSNATDGVGELQVADGALSQVTTLLDRAVTLATESATGTVSNSQRGALDAEYQSIKAEINSIGSTTNFNGGQVFTNNTLNVFLSDGSVSGSSTIGVSTGLLSSTSLSIGGTPATATLAEAVATPAARATNVLTGGTFVGSTQANSLLTASTQFNALTNASATFTWYDQPRHPSQPSVDGSHNVGRFRRCQQRGSRRWHDHYRRHHYGWRPSLYFCGWRNTRCGSRKSDYDSRWQQHHQPRGSSECRQRRGYERIHRGHLCQKR